MPVQRPPAGKERDDIATAATVAAKVMNMVGTECQWLAATGLDEGAVDAILTNGMIIALANVYQATSFHGEEGLIGMVRGQLRACRLRGSN
jgi:hypothetical protein